MHSLTCRWISFGFVFVDNFLFALKYYNLHQNYCRYKMRDQSTVEEYQSVLCDSKLKFHDFIYDISNLNARYLVR